VRPIDKRPGLVRRALSGHAALGLIVGALMYLIVLSGTLAVVGERWQRWEQPDAPEVHAIAPAAVQRAVEAAVRAEAEPPANILVQLPTDDLPRASIAAGAAPAYVDADGRLAGPVAHGWSDFILALHEYLNLPTTIGLILVGALGSMLAALAVTGVVAHPRIFRDAFRLRARGNRQLAQADWHNRLAVWTLPFGLAVAITGAFLGLAVLGATAIADRYHGGDIMRTYAPIFGDQTSPGGAPAPVADVAAALETMADRFPQARPTYVTIARPGTAGQAVQVLAEHPHRLIYGESYRFDGRGRYLGHVGLSDGAVGQQAAASTYKLHFGDFGGPAVEAAYLLLGIALTVVSATGMSLWLQKRRRRGEPSPRLEAFWSVIVWGAPILLVATYWSSAAGGTHPARAFWIALAVALVAGMARPRLADPATLRRLLGAATGATGLGHMVLAGAGAWSLAIDVPLVVIGAALLLADRRRPGLSGSSGPAVRSAA
jgi:uncharacterized iron-regulated membrane protein